MGLTYLNKPSFFGKEWMNKVGETTVDLFYYFLWSICLRELLCIYFENVFWLFGNQKAFVEVVVSVNRVCANFLLFFNNKWLIVKEVAFTFF